MHTFFYNNQIQDEAKLPTISYDKPITTKRSTSTWEQAIAIKRLTPYANLPIQSTPGSTGLDLFASQSHTIQPGQRQKINTDILAIQLPPRLYGRIAPRSGLSMSNSIDIAAGVVDNDYSGEIIPCVINNGTTTFVINKYDKIAQLNPTHYSNLTLFELDYLCPTSRDKGGFGSTEKPKHNPQPKIVESKQQETNSKYN